MSDVSTPADRLHLAIKGKQSRGLNADQNELEGFHPCRGAPAEGRSPEGSRV